MFVHPEDLSTLTPSDLEQICLALRADMKLCEQRASLTTNSKTRFNLMYRARRDKSLLEFLNPKHAQAEFDKERKALLLHRVAAA